MVKASALFKDYRNQTLQLPVEDFRSLQKGKSVKVEKKILDLFPDAFEKTKVVKNGD